MTRSWTFGRKLGMGFAAVAGIGAVLALVSLYALKNVVEEKDRVISIHGENLIDAWKLAAAREGKGAAVRGYLLTRDEKYLSDMKNDNAEMDAILERQQAKLIDEESRRKIELIGRAHGDLQAILDRATAARKSASPDPSKADPSLEAALKIFEDEAQPKREELNRRLTAFVEEQQRGREQSKQKATDSATFAMTLVVVLTITSVVAASGIAFVLTGTLSRQIGTAVQHVQSSSSELQVASNQQAAGAKEHASAMSEITTTINELLATSRQIAESAQRVARIAQETAGAAKGGDQTVQKVQESIGAIKRQVDVIVNHMLDLGRKSQQIGGILEIITELADQTNILSINASIEAAGAGEAGRRFSVVAEEIRKLADRVAGSIKEIRGLVEEIRAAVNSTVMATEGGAKAVEAGARQYGDVAASFKQIASLVGTTTEAAREIELSTRQQATAVEQVNVAVTSVAQATKESEVSTTQTLQTATQLASLSTDLSRLIHPQAAG